MAQNSATKHLKFLKQIVNLAVANSYMTFNPFLPYKIEREPVEIDFLDEEELRKIINFDTPLPRLERAKDMFLFGCYTFLTLINKHQFISKLQFNQGVIGNDLETSWLRCYALVFVFQIAVAKLQKIILPTIISSIHIPIQHSISIEEKLFSHKFTLNKDSFVCCSEYHQGVVYRSC